MSYDEYFENPLLARDGFHDETPSIRQFITFFSWFQVQERFGKVYPMSEWRYELRVRYIPKLLDLLYDKDRVTFFFLYDQVKYYTI